MERGETVHLTEVDEAVEDGDDVVDAEDKRIKDGGGDEAEAEVEVVELGEGEDEEGEEEEPGAVIAELVLLVD